jgi:hypothetical protein
LQPGSIAALGVSFVAGSMLSVMFAVPYTAFYSRTPQKLLGRVGSLGAAYGSLVGALAALAFGRLIHTVSAPHALLFCALIMAGITLALSSMPFMRLLDNPADSTPTPATVAA